MNPEEIQQAIDAGIASGMEALKTANDLSSITLIFGIVVAFLIVVVMALVVVIIVLIIWYRSQKGTNENQQRASESTTRALNVATDLGIEAAALRASNSAVLENDAIRSKAMSALAQAVDVTAGAMERITTAVATMGKSIDTVSAGQATLNTTTMTVSQKINETLKNMNRMELRVQDFLTGLSEQGYDIQKLAENEVRPTDKTRADVKDIADNRPVAPAPAAATTEPVKPDAPAPVHVVVDAPADTPATVIVATDTAANKAAVAAVGAVSTAIKKAEEAVQVANAESIDPPL